MTVLVTLLAVVVALVALLVAGLLRSHAEILRALDRLGQGLDPDASTAGAGAGGFATGRGRAGGAGARRAADITGVTPTGDAVRVAVAGTGHPTLLVFLTTACTTCGDFWSAFAQPATRRVPGAARLVVVTKGEEAESLPRLRRLAPPELSVVMSSEAWEAYEVQVAPYFVAVDGESGAIVGEGAATSWSQLAGMMDQAAGDAGRIGRRHTVVGRGA